MIAKIVRQNLLAIVAAYRAATGKSMTQVSKEFYGNATFFEQLRRGRHSISVQKLDKMLGKIRARWPAGTRWPPTRMVGMGREPQE
jgi:hypothetical protein